MFDKWLAINLQYSINHRVDGVPLREAVHQEKVIGAVVRGADKWLVPIVILVGQGAGAVLCCVTN